MTSQLRYAAMRWRRFIVQPTTRIPVSDTTQVGEARRAIARIAATAGLSETDAGAAAVVANELANNLVRYGKDGAILAQRRPGQPIVDILSIDRGPGIADVGRCLRDGYSTGGTPGNGLGAVRRMSAEFDIYSQSEVGTIVFASIGAPTSPPAFQCVGLALAAPSETVCGDAYCISATTDAIRFMMADGLGHGPAAAEAADRACHVVNGEADLDPHVALQRASGLLSSTRGAAVAIGTWSPGAGTLQYAGAGNISGAIVEAGRSRGLLSHHGIVGKQMRTPRQADYEAPADAVLLLHSDGIQTRWSPCDWPGLFSRHAAIIAACILRDCVRGKDDASVLVIRAVQRRAS